MEGGEDEGGVGEEREREGARMSERVRDRCRLRVDREDMK